MSRARKIVWTATATVVLVTSAVAASMAGAEGSTAVEAADTSTERSTTTTTVQPTTTTTAPTTTAAPATTVPPTTAPPTTVPPTTVPPTTAPPTTAAPPPAAPPPPPPPAPAAPRNGTRNTGCEQFMYDHINAARASAGVHGLAFDTAIQSVAVAWSDHLAGTQVLAHNPNYADQILVHRDYRTAAENVGRGHDLGRLFQAFMDSPGHRRNILAGVSSHVTVGCLTDGSGQLWVTQNFWGS